MDFNTTKGTRGKDRHYMMIKETLHQEDVTASQYTGCMSPILKYTKQLLTELKRETDKNAIIVGHLNTPLATVD